ncbi:sister chromatid cohesion protein PDS5 homolog C-like isoform X2 [Actinidia eriantha]|uniref:sister chromatid cohesion protein PDS5 homolog C-like isoform X2 n=1 Tax=Actinidia eriantha TaxID=165200 RepID=UPI00258FFCF8|nr:sister chromatid cohesion protein PDS5 homolog C-like isoform X2 [Actinidia eriantha]
MASASGELEKQLVEAGNSLLQPPSSVDELFSLLDKVENLLSRVEQSPSKSMQTALSPSMNALVTDELLRHPDVDVKVAVASCISEITRITAPDAPYDDDQMKDIFQLIVSSFENLSDKSSKSYGKRAMILETVAKVRSCVVMLDLECDGLIVEMFQHFLKDIRDYHPDNIFSSMETIMTLVLEESEDISMELISPILASVKRDSQEVLPIARKLGERVFGNCAVKLKPFLKQAMKSLGFSFDDYSEVIASICDGANGAVGHNDDNAGEEHPTEDSKLAMASSEGAAQADENKLAVASPHEAAQLTGENSTEARPEGDHPSEGRSSKSVMSNGDAATGYEDRMADLESSKKLEDSHQADQLVETNATSNTEPDDSNGGKLVKPESKTEGTSKKKGMKPKSLINSTEPSDSSRVGSDKEAEKAADLRKSSKEVHSSPSEEQSAEVAVPSENEKENIQLTSPKELESEPTDVASHSPSVSVPSEGRSKKGGRPKKKDSLIQEVAPSTDVSKMASEGTSDSEVKPRRGKKAPAEEKTPALADKSKSEGGTLRDSDAKPLNKCDRKVDEKVNTGDGSSSKKDGKKRGRGKATSENDLTKSTTKNDGKESVASLKPASKLAKVEGQSEETPKTSSKRKGIPGKEKASDIIEYGDNLISKKVKVWWPKDQKFYKGVIDSFDPVKKKHKVLYTDGDEEVLNLRTQKWEFVGDGSVTDEEQAIESQSLDASPEMHKKKKARTNSEPSAKPGKMEGSREGEASSGKLKGAATKSGHKSTDDNEVDGKSKDNTSKSGGKSAEGGKSKDRSKKSSGKSIGGSYKTAGKSKDDDSALKTITKLKLETPKTTSKETPKTTNTSKGKGSKSGKKPNANGSGKMKSGSVKVKETEEKEESPEPAKTPQSAKGKSPGTSKVKGNTGGKKGKKRRRGA